MGPRRGAEPNRHLPAGWDDVFTGDASRGAYQRALRQHTAVAWDVVETGHDDLLRLLIGRVPAELGVAIILGLSVLFTAHPKGDDAGRALLATILSDLDPQRARTLLVALEDAWHNVERQPFDRRADGLRESLLQGLRRLQATELPEAQREALGFISGLIGPSQPDAG